MFFTRLTPLVPEATLADPKSDYRTAEKIGFFRISKQAFYQPNGCYIPRAIIENAVNDRGSAHVTGCCAGGVPASRLVVTAAGKKFPILCDSDKMAAKLANMLNEPIE